MAGVDLTDIAGKLRSSADTCVEAIEYLDAMTTKDDIFKPAVMDPSQREEAMRDLGEKVMISLSSRQDLCGISRCGRVGELPCHWHGSIPRSTP